MRASRALFGKVRLSCKIPNFKYIYISPVFLFLISLSNINSGQRVCHASKYRRGRLGGLARVVKVACGTRWQRGGRSYRSEKRSTGREKLEEKKTRVQTRGRGDERGTKRGSMRSAMSRVIRAFPRDDLARVCGAAVLVLGKKKKIRCLYNESVSTQITRNEEENTTRAGGIFDA